MIARFWVYTGDCALVKITLRDGQTLHHSTGGATDEGWSRESVMWTFENGVVTRHSCNDGVDCDGRLTRSYVDSCSAANLASEPAYYHPGFKIPAWETVNASQRDYSAEAMNY